MKIFIKRSGGLANIGPIQGELDTAELMPDLAQEVSRLIKLVSSGKAGKKNLFMADGQQISVGFRPSDSDKDPYLEYEIDESSVDPELFGICNELANQVVKNSLTRRRAEAG